MLLNLQADKASILGDAILYLKDLQSKIQELEQSNQESKQRYQELELRYKEIEQQNKELKGNRFMSSAISQPCPWKFCHPCSTHLNSRSQNTECNACFSNRPKYEEYVCKWNWTAHTKTLGLQITNFPLIRQLHSFEFIIYMIICGDCNSPLQPFSH